MLYLSIRKTVLWVCTGCHYPITKVSNFISDSDGDNKCDLVVLFMPVNINGVIFAHLFMVLLEELAWKIWL